MRGFLFASAVLLMACGTSGSKNQVQKVEKKSTAPTHFRSEIVEGYFDSLARSGKFSGTILLAKGDSILTYTNGLRRLKGVDSLELNDVFQLASLSKPITALGLLRLVEQGKVDLDATVRQYLFDFPDDQITVRSLLNHTSGLGNYIYVTDSLWNNPDSFMRNEDMYELVRCEQVPDYFEPFKKFNYCNTNYALIPILIERVSGLTFERFMAQEVFSPLEMDSTHFLDPWSRMSDEYKVIGHYPNGDPKRPFYLDGVIGDKSLYSSVLDLHKLYQGLNAHELWSEELLSEAMKPSVKASGVSFYGLGWRLRPIQQDTLVFHNGWWRGFRSYFWMSKKKDKVAIILTNSIRGGYLSQDEIWSLF